MKAVFTTKPHSIYDDAIEIYDGAIELRYHFPKTYLNQVSRAVGDFIVYYEPRRVSTHDSIVGGRQSYFAAAFVEAVEPDPQRDGLFYAFLSGYLDFDRPVPFIVDQHYFEHGLRKEDGTTNKGAFGRAVRSISDTEFDAILRAGFSESIGESESASAREMPGFGEPAPVFERPLVELTTHRRFRDRVFSRHVRSAYDLRCAITGLRIINGGGRPEVQAAHIRPVAENGPDSIRNGLALSSTIHWMFDRGLVSVTDDYRIITAEQGIPDQVRDLINPTKRLLLPAGEQLRPHPDFLRFHRRNVFKGAA